MPFDAMARKNVFPLTPIGKAESHAARMVFKASGTLELNIHDHFLECLSALYGVEQQMNVVPFAEILHWDIEVDIILQFGELGLIVFVGWIQTRNLIAYVNA